MIKMTKIFHKKQHITKCIYNTPISKLQKKNRADHQQLKSTKNHSKHINPKKKLTWSEAQGSNYSLKYQDRLCPTCQYSGGKSWCWRWSLGETWGSLQGEGDHNGRRRLQRGFLWGRRGKRRRDGSCPCWGWPLCPWFPLSGSCWFLFGFEVMVLGSFIFIGLYLFEGFGVWGLGFVVWA